MACRVLIESRWTVGGNFFAGQKKFVKFDNVIPGLKVDINYKDCDIEGWTLRAYFKYPGMLETDPCIYQEQLVVNNSATFDLDGTLLGTFGTWEVELVLLGLGIDPEKENIGTTNTIKYEVLKNCEGLEVPPIPPQETCNTVDELIQELDEKITEGENLKTGLDESIAEGTQLKTDLDLSITTGTQLKTDLDQSITEGEDLLQEIDDTIAAGDVLQKGVGYDDVKYPYAVDITNDLEQKMYSLDSRLVYAFEPSKRNIENLEHGMHVKDPLTNGDGTIWSEDADSMSGVFDDENGSFYCGEGYDNIWTQKGGGSNFVASTIAESVIIAPEIQPLDMITITFKVKPNSSSIIRLNLWGNDDEFEQEIISEPPYDNVSSSGVDYNVDNETDIRLTIRVPTDFNPVQGNLSVSDLISVSQIEKFLLTKTSTPVHFVKDTAPNGKLVIKEPWTSGTHSIILKGVILKENPRSNNYYFYLCSNGGEEAIVTVTSNPNFTPGDLVDVIISNTVGIAINLTKGIEGIMSFGNRGVSGTDIKFKGGYDGQDYYEGIFYYEGNLIEAELRAELDKIKSGQYYVENRGVYEPVQGAKKRANEYGQTKNFVYIESQSTDLQLVETNKLITTKAYDGTERIDRVDNTGVITPVGTGGGVEDVGGYIRLTAATSPSPTTKVKVVIEVEN